MKKIVLLALSCMLCVSLCACNSDSAVGEEKSPEELVRSVVEERGRDVYFGATINGNELESSEPVITSVKEISEKEYEVSGIMVLTDVYGDKWENRFDCTVERFDSGPWHTDGFKYASTKWTKQ